MIPLLCSVVYLYNTGQGPLSHRTECPCLDVYPDLRFGKQSGGVFMTYRGARDLYQGKLVYKTLAFSLRELSPKWVFTYPPCYKFYHAQSYRMPEENSNSYRVELKSFQDWNGDCPSQTLIFHHNCSSWWIRVKTDWSLPKSMLEHRYLQRKSTFRTFVEAIDFAQLPLLENTMTSIELRLTGNSGTPIAIRNKSHAETNYFIKIAPELLCTIVEDSKRVIYPPLAGALDLPLLEACELQKSELIAHAVSTVYVKQQKFAFKTIDRQIYEPQDTEHILDEIQALAKFRGQPNIAQLVGLVASENPYKTHPSTEMPRVITGFLLKYYPRGSLDRIIEENKMQDDSLAIKWATQIGLALKILHDSGRTHLDIKPSNVVVDAEQNAVLIDISGTGGYTWEWLSPEMQLLFLEDDDILPSTATFEARIATDCWAYGRLLTALASKTGICVGGEILRGISVSLTDEVPESRISLEKAIIQLEGINRQLA